MSSFVLPLRVPATVLSAGMILACVGCAETQSPPAAIPEAAAVVEEVVDESAPEEEVVVVEETVASPADEPPAADHDSATSRITKLVELLGSATDDSRARVVAIDEITTLNGYASLTLEPLSAALADAEPRVRWHAARAIGLIGRDAVPAIPALAKLLNDADPVVVAQAAAAIGHIRDDDERAEIPADAASIYASAVEPLVATMVHPDPRARRAAVRALRQVSTSRQELAKTVRKQLADADPIAVMPALHTLADMGADAVPFLLESLDDPASRYWAEVVLAELGPDAAPAVDPLARLAREGEIAEKMQAILALAEIGPAAAPAVPAVIESLSSSDSSLQYVAAFALGKIGAGEADAALREAAAADDPFLASLASWALATIHPDDAALQAEAVDRLQGGLTSDVPAVRNAAVEGLSDLAPRLGEPDRKALAKAFAGLLTDPMPTVGLAAGGGLIRLGADALDALRAALAEQPVRNDALEILSVMGPQALPALDDLVAALADSDPVCRSDAAFAIASIGPEAKAAVPALEQVLGDESAEATVRYTAAYALGKMGSEAASAEPLLRKLVDSEDEQLATVCVWAVLKIKPGDKPLVESAVPKLRNALQGEREMIRLEAAVALGEIGPPAASAVPMLEMLAEDDPSSAVRAAAKAAVRRIRP